MSYIDDSYTIIKALAVLMLHLDRLLQNKTISLWNNIFSISQCLFLLPQTTGMNRFYNVFRKTQTMTVGGLKLDTEWLHIRDLGSILSESVL